VRGAKARRDPVSVGYVFALASPSLHCLPCWCAPSVRLVRMRAGREESHDSSWPRLSDASSDHN
jgi:hypothetical protein